MNLILEGPDCAGKTTLAQKVVSLQQEGVQRGEPERLRAEPFHNGVWDDPFKEYLKQFHVALTHPGASHVWDRFWPSNGVYSPVMGGAQLDLRQLEVCEHLSRYLDCVGVLCKRPPEDVLEDWKARKGAEYVDGEGKMERIIQTYYQSPQMVFGRIPWIVAFPFLEEPERILEMAFAEGSRQYEGFNERWGNTWRDCLR